MKPFVFFVIIFCNSSYIFSQNRIYAQKTIDTLASNYFAGRGYINEGDTKATNFIENEFIRLNIKPFKSATYRYPFSFNVNTFPKNCAVSIDGKKLVPGKDFVVNPACPSIRKKLKISPILNWESYPKYPRKEAILYDTSYKINKEDKALSAKFDLSIHLEKKLTWSVSTFQNEKAGLQILKSSFPSTAKVIKVKIKSKLIYHVAYNVLGYIEGTEIKDTFIVLTAHYDHLGKMGKAIFPGANDNASGVAMMLDMANYFAKNPPKYSIAFIAFAGEEAGLIGSKSYTDKAWEELPLEQMKFLINLDLMGSGEDGMAVVNATEFDSYFDKLKSINDEKHYLKKFKVRGKASNSDHYWFVERGVKGFFFYLMGDYHHYHDIFDIRENLILGEYYDKSFLLIRDFINKI